MRNLKNLILIAGLSLAGCRDASNDFVYRGKIEDYNAVACFDGVKRIAIMDGKNCISARDFAGVGRFNEISLSLPKGHALEKYASLEKLEEVYDKLKAEYTKIKK